MIELASGHRAQTILRRIRQQPETLRQVFLCSPFIDAKHRTALCDVIARCRSVQTGVTILTTTGAAGAMLSLMAGASRRWSCAIVPIPGLHAKAYLAIGRSSYRSEGLISSCNLTNAGTQLNLEIGVYFTSDSPAGSRLLSQTMSFVSNALRGALTCARV